MYPLPVTRRDTGSVEARRSGEGRGLGEEEPRVAASREGSAHILIKRPRSRRARRADEVQFQHCKRRASAPSSFSVPPCTTHIGPGAA